MVRHVVLFRFKPDASPSDKQSLCDGLAALPATISEIQRYEFGPDLSLADGNFDFAVVADFESTSDFKVYAAHTQHQKLIADLVRPILAERVAVQYEF